MCAAASKAWAPIALKSRWGTSISAVLQAARPRRHRTAQSISASSAVTVQRGSYTISHRQCRSVLMDGAGPLDPHAAAQVGDIRRGLDCRKSGEPRRPASMTSAALVPSASFHISTTYCSLALRLAATRSKAIARNARPTSIGTRFAKKPIKLKIPITIAGMSFGSLSAQAKEALGRGASAAWEPRPRPATVA